MDGGLGMVKMVKTVLPRDQVRFDKIDPLRWPAMPNPRDIGRSGGEVWVWPHYRCHFQIDPSNATGDGYYAFPYVASVFDQHDRHILSAVLEQTDYRRLAQLTGENPRDLMGIQKGYLSPIRVALYSADKHEGFGSYDGDMDVDSVRHFLLEMVADELDLLSDPILRGPLEANR